MKKIFSTIGLFIASLVPSVAAAHEQWFQTNADPTAPLPAFYTEWSVAKIVMIAVVLAGFAIACLLHFVILKKFAVTKKIKNWVSRYSVFAPTLMRGTLGIIFLVASFNGFFMAPDLKLAAYSRIIGLIFWYAQFVISFSLIFGMLVRPMSIAAIIMYLISFGFFPVTHMISYLGFAGALVYLVAVGNPSHDGSVIGRPFKKLDQWLTAHQHQAITGMRILLGLSLVAMGFGFKILAPQQTIALLQNYDVNFIAGMGLTSVTNEMFVFLCGLAEITFGLMLVFGIVPRLLSLKLFVIFALPILVFGSIELFGHLPLYALFFTVITEQKKEA